MWQNCIAFIFLCVAAMITVVLKKLDVKAAATAVIIGFAVWLGEDYAGIVLLATFFIAGTLTTSLNMRKKQQAGLAEKSDGQRTAGQVIANGGVAAILSLMAFLFNEYKLLLLLMIASALSSATADTVSSELGDVYGKKFYNIISLKKDMRGLNGIVSFEGTLMGIGGSCLIALIYSLYSGFTIHFIFIIIAGTAGNFIDSVLGATLERKHVLNNNAVNSLNTLAGALTGLLLYYV